MEYAVVTVRIPEKNLQLDMEIPVKMSICTLSGKILETMKMTNETEFEGVNMISLYFKNEKMHGEKRPLDYQIWDGAILDVHL